MKHIIRLIFFIPLISSLLLVACMKPPSKTQNAPPSRIETIKGTDIKKVVLTEKAAKRLDIQTKPVQRGTLNRKQVVGGELVINPMMQPGEIPAATTGNEAWVKVALVKSDLTQVDRSKSVRILLPDQEAATDVIGPDDLVGEEVEVPGKEGAIEEEYSELYYVIKNGGQRLSTAGRLKVEFSLKFNGAKRILVPYAAIIYNAAGDTFVYVNTAPLVYVRTRVIVDYIEGDQAYLVVGPPDGSKVVTVGAAELYGAETGVSK